MSNLSALFKKNLFWVVLILSVFIPLYPKFPFINVPGTYVAIRLEDFLIALAVLCWFIAVLPELKNILSKNFTQAFLLFWAIGALSLFSGIFLTHTVSPQLGLFHYLRRIEVMLLFFIAYTALVSEQQIKTWLKVMSVVTLIVIVYGFGQQWLSFPVISTTNKEFSKGLILYLSPEARINSTFAGHYDLAAYLAIFLALSTTFFIYINNFVKKTSLGVLSLVSFILLALTAARVSFVAAILGIISVFIMLRQKKLIFLLLGLSILAFGLSPELRHRTVATLTVNLLGGGGAKYVPPPQKPNPDKAFSIENAASGAATPSGVPVDIAPGEPLNTTELGVYRSFGIRLNEEWPRAIRAFLKNPFLGTGYSSITIASDNDYLRSLGETGLLGAASLILIWLIITRGFWQLFKNNENKLRRFLAVGLISVVLVVAINASFIDILESSKVASLLWITLGLGFAVNKIKNI